MIFFGKQNVGKGIATLTMPQWLAKEKGLV